MSGRPTAEIVADLRAERKSWIMKLHSYALLQEAADRLVQFDTIEARLNAELATAYNTISELNAENDRLRYSKAIG